METAINCSTPFSAAAVVKPQYNHLFDALSKAQGEFEHAIKDSKNPHLRSKYADLASVLDVTKPVLHKYGLSYIQHPSAEGDRVSVRTMLCHSSGQFVESTLTLPIGRTKDAQGVGSSITYARRYALAAILGIAQDDDDGNSDMPREPSHKVDPNAVTAEMLTGLFSLVGTSTMTPVEVSKIISEEFGLKSSRDLNKVQYNDLVERIKKAQQK